MFSVERDLKDHLVTASLSWAGTPATTAGCKAATDLCFNRNTVSVLTVCNTDTGNRTNYSNKAHLKNCD